MKPKSINALMAHMRNNKGIAISGSLQKKRLRYMGYFHGYKGYRFCHSPSNSLHQTNFNELQAVYDFDMQLKAILYPKVMHLETSMKNYALECILEAAGSTRFADVYAKVLNDYKCYSIGSKEYGNAIKKSMNVRNRVYYKISKEYDKNIVKHYYDKDKHVPIWAIFELISLGEFANLLKCVNLPIRKNISKEIGIKSTVDPDGMLVPSIIFTLRDLRNAIAHNNIVFDTRFKTGNINKRISNYLEQETKIRNITFDTIVDYVILISFLLKILQYNKGEITPFISQFQNACETLRKSIPISQYTKIIHTDTKNKIEALKRFL